MSLATSLIEPPNGGPTRAAVCFQSRWRYFRAASGVSPPDGQADGMLPDPAKRPVMTAEEAFAELGIDRGTGYKAIRDGTFPVPIIRVGRIIRVPTAAVRRLLLVDPETPIERSEAS
jgi:predicted DNA-binding transcriptional regulator AlpA